MTDIVTQKGLLKAMQAYVYLNINNLFFINIYH